jgi:hypothetical protein
MFITPDGQYPCNGECGNLSFDEAIFLHDMDRRVHNIAATLGAIVSSTIVFSVIYLATDCFIELNSLDNKQVYFLGELRSFHQLNRIISVSMAFLGFFMGWNSSKVKLEELDKQFYQKNIGFEKLS